LIWPKIDLLDFLPFP